MEKDWTKSIKPNTMTQLDEILKILEKLASDVHKEHKRVSIPRVFYTNTIVRLTEMKRLLKKEKNVNE